MRNNRQFKPIRQVAVDSRKPFEQRHSADVELHEIDRAIFEIELPERIRPWELDVLAGYANLARDDPFQFRQFHYLIEFIRGHR